MAKMKMNGFGNTKMFTADDLKNMSPEEMNEKVFLAILTELLILELLLVFRWAERKERAARRALARKEKIKAKATRRKRARKQNGKHLLPLVLTIFTFKMKAIQLNYKYVDPFYSSKYNSNLFSLNNCQFHFSCDLKSVQKWPQLRKN